MKKVLQATIEEKLLEMLKEQAKIENRSLSNLVETLLYKALDDNKSVAV